MTCNDPRDLAAPHYIQADYEPVASICMRNELSQESVQRHTGIWLCDDEQAMLSTRSCERLASWVS